MTAEELIRDIDSCYGPCGELCLSCPEAHYLKEIREVVAGLMEERDMLKETVAELARKTHNNSNETRNI